MMRRQKQDGLTKPAQPSAGMQRSTNELLDDVEYVPVPFDIVRNEKTGAVVIGRFTISKQGLVIADGVSEDEWLGFGEIILQMRGSLAVMLGDWLAHGELMYGGWYQRFIESFGLDDQTLYDYKWVCGSVQISLRKENLFYNHYKTVAALTHEEKVMWLERASIGDGTAEQPKRWSARRLDAEIKGFKPPRPSIGESVHLLQFERKYNPFMERVSKIASKANPVERRQMAEYLRTLADRVESGK